MELGFKRYSIRTASRPLFIKILNNINRYKFMYLLVLPGLLFFILFHYYPMYFLQVAFKKYSVFKGIDGSPWIGLKNFYNLFETKYFLQAFWNTVVLSLMNKAVGFPVPIILALLLNEIRNRYYKRTVQTLVYLPHFLSWVIIGGIWMTLLSPNGGLVNEFVKLTGNDPIFFMADKDWFRWVLVFTNTWKEAGWGTIIYLAAISGIDPDLYESSIIDGANRFKQVLHITLPGIIPAIIVVFILSLAKILNIFEQVFVMYNPIVAEVSETIDTYVYQIGIVNGDMSFGVAVGLFKSIISCALIIGTNIIVKKYQGQTMI